LFTTTAVEAGSWPWSIRRRIARLAAVKAGPTLQFHDNGRPKELVLASSYLVAGRQYERGTFLRFDRDGRLVLAHQSLM
jgi:hypothetical protein